jgi:hypothetical protein
MKSLFEQMGGTYLEVGDYLIPNLSLPEDTDVRPIGVWGERRRRYLKEHRKVLYYNLLTSGTLHSHLADINDEAEEMFSRLVKQMAAQQGITENLKAENQILWVGRMNNIRNAATEIVNQGLIFS